MDTLQTVHALQCSLGVDVNVNFLYIVKLLSVVGEHKEHGTKAVFVCDSKTLAEGRILGKAQRMETRYRYVWQHFGLYKVEDTTLEDLTGPLTKGAMFADLRNGHIFEVVAAWKLEGDTDNQSPKEKVHTHDGLTLSDAALDDLRVRCEFDKGYKYAIWP